MAEDDDPFASMIHDCLYSSSQEELLRYSKFAREDEIFAGDTGKAPASVNSGRPPVELASADVAGRSNRVEVAGVRAACDEKRDLGFPQEKKSSTIEVVFDGEVRVGEVPSESERGQGKERENPEEGSSIEPPLKKPRVSGSKLKGKKVSPLVQCSEKIVLDSEDKGKQIVVFKGGVKVEIVSPLRCFAPTGVECTEELVVAGEHDTAQDDMRGAKLNPAKKKLEFEGNTVVIEVEEEETNEPKKNKETGSDVDKRDGNGKSAETQQDGSSEEIEIRGKRELPCSLLGQIWGLNVDGSDGTGNGSSGTHNREKAEETVEENVGQKSRTDQSLKHLLGVLKMLATQMLCDADVDEIDIFETAKRRGMTFPRSRFCVHLEMDE